jgi:hypothetical protein
LFKVIAIVAEIAIINIVMRAMFENSGMLVEGCGVIEDPGVLVGDGVIEDPEATAITESAASV